MLRNRNVYKLSPVFHIHLHDIYSCLRNFIFSLPHRKRPLPILILKGLFCSCASAYLDNGIIGDFAVSFVAFVSVFPTPAVWETRIQQYVCTSQPSSRFSAYPSDTYIYVVLFRLRLFRYRTYSPSSLLSASV